jgi:hypothetical protein
MKVMALTKRQEQILVGSILGDGGVYVHKTGKNASYYVKQSDPYREYLFWLFNELREFCLSKPNCRSDNGQWYFHTRTAQDFTQLRETFYPRGVKVIPNNISDLLRSPLGLAVWFMDDGTLDYREKSHCSFWISTHSFSVGDCWKLVSILKSNFGIDATVYNHLIRGKRYPRIYIGSKGRDKFIETIKPHIIDCFKYKLPEFRRTPQRLSP